MKLTSVQSFSFWWHIYNVLFCIENMLFELEGFLVRNANLMSTEMSRLEVWACDVITLCEEEGWGRLTARGRDGLAAELKDLQFSQPEHRVTLAKDKGRKSIHCYWKFSNQQLQFKMWQPSGDLNPYTSEWLWHCCCVFIISQKIIITLINSSWSEPASAARTSFYLFGKQSKFVGEVFAHKVYLDLV